MKEILDWLESKDRSLLVNKQLCDKTRLLLLDTIICIVSGSKSNEVKRLVRTVSELNAGKVRFPGENVTIGLLDAAYVATLAACWDEACEGLARAHGRPGLHVVPAATILGVDRRLCLGQVLKAIIWGYEVGGRVGEAMQIRPGLHVDGSWGSIAASVAAAKTLGLDIPRTFTAMNIACSQISTGIFLPI